MTGDKNAERGFGWGNSGSLKTADPYRAGEALFTWAVAYHSEASDTKIGLEMGYYRWTSINQIEREAQEEAERDGVVYERGKYNIRLDPAKKILEQIGGKAAYAKYRARISQGPYDELRAIGLLNGSEHLFVIHDQGEIDRYLELKLSEYLHQHNKELYAALQKEENEISPGLKDDQLNETEKGIIQERINLIKPMRAAAFWWLSNHGYIGGVITKPAVGRKKGTLAQFPVAAGTKWHEVEMVFIEFDKIMITARGQSKTYLFNEIGFLSRNPNEPGFLWKILQLFAMSNGVVCPSEEMRRMEFTSEPKRQISNLRKKLKNIIPIEGNPISYSPWARDKVGVWKGEYHTQFKIKFDLKHEENQPTWQRPIDEARTPAEGHIPGSYEWMEEQEL